MPGKRDSHKLIFLKKDAASSFKEGAVFFLSTPIHVL